MQTFYMLYGRTFDIKCLNVYILYMHFTFLTHILQNFQKITFKNILSYYTNISLTIHLVFHILDIHYICIFCTKFYIFYIHLTIYTNINYIAVQPLILRAMDNFFTKTFPFL
jgi:hypothetical protein